MSYVYGVSISQQPLSIFISSTRFMQNNSLKIKALFHGALDLLFPPDTHTTQFEHTSSEDLWRLLVHSGIQEIGTLRFTSLFAYADEKTKSVVWEIKYYGNQKITEIVGRLLAQEIQKELSTRTQKELHTKLRPKSEPFIVIPIPLTQKRIRERGYHHTELIAKATIQHLPDTFEYAGSVLRKIRHTPKQSSVEDRQDRFKNIRGAFAIADSAENSEKVRGRHIILLDDVITTGATVAEAKRVLLAAGAASVSIFSIAH